MQLNLQLQMIVITTTSINILSGIILSIFFEYIEFQININPSNGITSRKEPQ
jgi:hypothetical protein